MTLVGALFFVLCSLSFVLSPSTPTPLLTAEQERVCVEAAEALGADYAGVDLLRAAYEGRPAA